MSERKGHPALKYRKDVAETFGINPEEQFQRELVKVDHIPTPPDVEHPEAPPRGKHKPVEPIDNPEDRVVVILREEMEELAVRLSRFGVNMSPSQQQAMIDYGLSVLAGYGGGGTLARRQ